MSIVLSRRLRAFEALAKLMLGKDGRKPGRPSRRGSRRSSSKPSRLSLIAVLVRRLRGR